MNEPSDLQVTTVIIRGPDEWPFTEVVSVWHRRDFADLGEPYLSAVKAKRAEIDSWTVLDHDIYHGSAGTDPLRGAT